MPTASPSVSAETITAPQALSGAADFLINARSEDGGWHSKKYRDMAEGPELSPFVYKALTYSGAASESLEPSVTYLKAQDPTKLALIYPVYTSAGMLLNRLDGKDRRWEKRLAGFQADEQLGWNPKDLAYGGWSYSAEPPIKPKGEVPSLSQSNLPSTLFALGGLSLSQRGLPKQTSDKALIFLQRCQNYPQGDGGFCASPSDEAMNKAGGHLSYGSATSDGVRALLRCGLPFDHPRVKAARAWMESQLSVEKHPGAFPEGRAYDRDSLFIYYCWSTAHALSALERSGATLTEKEQSWREQIVEVLIAKQNKDGSWTNPAAATREDDPLVATPMVMAVLALSSPEVHHGR